MKGLVIHDRAGLLIAIHQGWSEVELESDSAMLINALNEPREDYLEMGRIVEDCKDYMLVFEFLEVRHIYREANDIVHRLAHLASCSVVYEL